MAVVVRCPKVACGLLTGWSYPNFQWARTRVRGLPPRCFLWDKEGRGHIMGMHGECPDPLGHVNEFLAARGAPLVSFEAPEVAPSEEDPEDPGADEVLEPEPDDHGVDWVERDGFRFPQLGLRSTPGADRPD